MSTYSPSVTRLINEFAKLPGIGRKTAERLSHHILRTDKEDAMGLSDAILTAPGFAGSSAKKRG